LLNEAEEDAFWVSDTVIGLTTKFGSDQLLLEYIAQCNLRRQQIATYRNRVNALKAELTLESLVELQLLLIQVRELRSICKKLRQDAEDIFSE
jgi:hypothetical protein